MTKIKFYILIKWKVLKVKRKQVESRKALI